MGDDVIITWTVENWITVVLMVVVAFTIFGLIAQFYHNRVGA